MKQPTITLQNGHRNAPNGQTGTGGEADLVDRVYYALAPLLIRAGIVVYYDDATVRNGAFTDYFIALHFDGSVNPAYEGGFVDVSPEDQVKDRSWAFARKVADYYFSAMGIRFLPEHRTANSTYYYAFNDTGAATQSFLIELGTLTSPHDRPLLQDYGKIASLLSDGIIAYLTETDDNYKGYLAGQTASQNQATADGLRQQLKEAQGAQAKIAAELARCQQSEHSLLERIDNIKHYVSEA